MNIISSAVGEQRRGDSDKVPQQKKKIRVNITPSVSIKKKDNSKIQVISSKQMQQKWSKVIPFKMYFSVNLISIQCYFSTTKILQSGISQILSCSDFQAFWNTHHCQSLI